MTGNRSSRPNADVAIIGAGLAGLSCARALRAAGARVQLFDKGRGPGGRLSGRRTPYGRFDHGAPLLPQGSGEYADVMKGWLAEGHIAPLRDEANVRSSCSYVGTPTMNAPVKALAASENVRFGVRIAGLERTGRDDWALIDDEGRTAAAARIVAITIPAPQAADLLGSPAPAIAEEVASIGFSPVWAGMVAFDGPAPALPGYLRGNGALSKAIRQSALPERELGNRWVLHAGEDWSREHLEDDAEAVGDTLLGLWQERSGERAPATYCAAHRWRYARVSNALPLSHRFDAALRIGVGGDGFAHGNIPGSVNSGTALGTAIGEFLGL